jgi:phosphoglucomutase
MTLDWDGRSGWIPLSPYAMHAAWPEGSLPIAAACDTDHDRHGIVTRERRADPPNHYLTVAIHTCSGSPRLAVRMRASARRS